MSVRNLHLPILNNHKADIFAASLLISYYTYSSLTLSSIIAVNFYILSERSFLKREE